MTKKEARKRLDVLKKELEEINKKIESFELDIDDYEEQYKECLNCDGPVIVAGMEFDADHILRECDPTAYRCGLIDYVDGIDKEEIPEYQELIEEQGNIEDEIEELEGELEN